MALPAAPSFTNTSSSSSRSGDISSWATLGNDGFQVNRGLTTKQLLMIGGVLVVGLIVYKKFT